MPQFQRQRLRQRGYQLRPLRRHVLVPPINQRIHIQAGAVHDVIREPFLPFPLETTDHADIAIPVFPARGLVVRDDLREDADALHAALRTVAHVVQAEVDGLAVEIHGEPLEEFLGAVVGQAVAVSAGGAFQAVHDPRGVVVGRHVRGVAVILASFWWGDRGVVLHDDSGVVAF